ncbi:uracil-DNA glycosylase [Rhizoctonia solani AG-1 IB]|uniref:Uracil-DNA glycosylase n=1 Tax=Thanatephorus cucumeris (strain AG1-IB / isolate 7/3/14) TaxID=1108050 RepID=M5CGX1_THACB|nr:uracil-DNA glycosylase [Rhizoctonia solani AG-1 IB]
MPPRSKSKSKPASSKSTASKPSPSKSKPVEDAKVEDVESGDVQDAKDTTAKEDTKDNQDGENYLDDTPRASQVNAESSPTKGKTTAKPETAAHTGEKRQRSIASMFGVTKKARASSPASARSSSPAAGDEPSASTSAGAKKTVNGVMALKYIPFSMDAFVAELNDEQKKLLQLECETLNKVWFKVLKDELTKPYFIKLKQFLWEEGIKDPETLCTKIYPPAKDIYSWSRCTPLGRVKVVIIGQDPYHGPKQAHGLCFSVRPGVQVPPSLRNMYKEIKSSYPAFEPPKHGYLTSWANQGVLLLNTSLTVRASQAGSHAGKGWETFTDAVVKAVDKYGGANLSGSNGVGRGVVFLAWGAWAGKRVAGLDKHPSPLSASRGFLGNEHFKKANDWLELRYGIDSKIDWCNLDVDAKEGGEGN